MKAMSSYVAWTWVNHLLLPLSQIEEEENKIPHWSQWALMSTMTLASISAGHDNIRMKESMFNITIKTMEGRKQCILIKDAEGIMLQILKKIWRILDGNKNRIEHL